MAKSLIPTEQEFDSKREELLKKVDELTREFKEFSRMVTSKQWRSLGIANSSLIAIGAAISMFDPIQKEELEIDWVLKELSKP
jgi:sugar-specific transcriptional regulator TrmB